ncbi:heme/copper-type cytochrome/quinol oxidase, subunit 1 [Cenarchaeum symbiosum A]|uniref:Heme/copper-type cytochrome/quinol oxidase, subunit 1 n=1 Tax=Cenarchaeum symbiosum (strain A) TaxID=414004 RepID=A0RZ19_CENSY|nr:heme/copper-type cytochrome/quinol oxidase, subunit 1 [Cenarchaeum symbiosum A]
MVLELQKPRPIWQIMFSTHHTDVGLLYLISSLGFLFLGGALALLIRAELFFPGTQFIADSMTFNRMFTVHGTTLIFLFILPFASAVGNYFVPIMVRYKDMAYPKLNAIAFWMIPPAGALVWLGFADFSWYATPPYSVISAPGPAADMWIFGLKILGISSILGSINFIVTILKCKHPDMSLGQVPLLAWSYLSSSLIVLVALPTFAAALLMLLTDRLGVSGFFNPAVGGDPIAYAHLFWFTFHPEVYVLVIPAIGMMYEMVPRFSRKPIYSYNSGLFAFVLLTIVGFSSWAHHMFATGMSFTEKTVFMLGTLAAVPASAMHVFNFVATMWNGRIRFDSPMMWSIGGIALFFSAGAGGVLNAAMPLDFTTHDTYWVVGHFHLFVMGTIAFGSIGFFYYMFPFVTGRMYNEKLGKIHFVFSFVGAVLLFFTQHILGIYGMPRRVYDYPPIPEWIAMNQIATVGAMLIGVGMAIFLGNMIHSSAKGKPANMEDPWGIGGRYYYPYQVKNPQH